LTALHSTAEAVKSAEGDVFLIGRPPRKTQQLFVGQVDEALKIGLP
jgi:hypothetical protein